MASWKENQFVRLKQKEPLWGHWRLGKQLGKGSFGYVYEVFDDKGIEEASALKVITVECQENEAVGQNKEEILKRRLKEVLAEIRYMVNFRDYPNFVTYFEFDYYEIFDEAHQIDGYDVLIRMEKLTSLSDRALALRKQNKRMEEKEIIRLAIDICTGLSQAYRQYKFMHRDIKMDNIFMSSQGVYKLGDLGVSALDQTLRTTMLGTPCYMAPEIFFDKEYGANVDLYALGMVMYELANGALPFAGVRDGHAMRLRGEPIPRLTNVSPALSQIIAKAVEFDPKNRWQSADEMLDVLQKCEDGITTEKICTDRCTEQMTKEIQPKSKKKKAVICAVVVAVALGTAAICWYTSYKQKLLDQAATELYQECLYDMNRGEYQDAVEKFNQIDPQWSEYDKVEEKREDAEELYKKSELDKAAQLCEDDKYSEALAVLDDLLEEIGEEDDVLNRQTSIKREEIADTANEYISEQKYDEAIQYLNDNWEIVDSDEELTQIFEDSKKNYRDSIFDKAEAAYDSEGYKAALDMIREGLNVLPEDQELLDKQQFYEAKKPVSLADYEVFSADTPSYSESMDIEKNEYNTDRFKNTYDSSFTKNYEGEATFLLAEEYTRFTGTVACPEGYETQSNLSNVKVTISGDGRTLYRSGESGPEIKPQEFDVDVTGVEMLKIEWECMDAMNIWNNWCAYGTIFDGYFHP